MDQIWDCMIVGGGAAGLSAALVLGRARQRTLLVDAGEPSNLPAHAMGGLLGQDGRSPADFYALARAQVAHHPSVELRDGEVTGGERDGDGFRLEVAGGHERARRVILATGMEYRTPDIPGLAPLWGDSVFHCPFCHGWEVRDQPLAVLAGGEQAVHVTSMLRAWSDDIVLLSQDVPEPVDGVAIDPRPVRELRAENGKLAEIVFEDGDTLPRKALLVATTFHQRSDLAHQLGAAQDDRGFLVVDAMLATTAPGVYAAGDVTGHPQSVAGAIAAGHLAAAMVVRDGM